MKENSIKMKTIVVLPAYNCAKTLKKTIEAIPKETVNEILLVDDFSTDDTLNVARSLGVKYICKHTKNLGYGANQKTCYDMAIALHADIVIMLHPDYQYDPRLIKEILNEFKKGADIVFASRMKKGFEALRQGMPIYKFVSNKVLTCFQNILLNKNLSEYHTGYRAYKASVLKLIDYHQLSNDFIFDNEIILSFFKCGYNISEIYCPAKYEKESSSINFNKSVKYGCAVIAKTIKFYFKK